jgi:hypothetical protein
MSQEHVDGNSRPDRGTTAGPSGAAGCGSSRASAIRTRRRRPATSRSASGSSSGRRGARASRRYGALRRGQGGALGAPRPCRDRPGVVGFTQSNVLERQLVMTPLARAAAGVTLEPATGAGRSGRDMHIPSYPASCAPPSRPSCSTATPSSPCARPRRRCATSRPCSHRPASRPYAPPAAHAAPS